MEGNKFELHSSMVEKVLREMRKFLTSKGIEKIDVSYPSFHTRVYSFVLNGIRVSVRVAQSTTQEHPVTVNGKRYCYDYRKFHFNFHTHGKPIDTDFIVCVCLDQDGDWSGDFFAFAPKDFKGLTFSLHIGKRPYRGSLAPYRGNWNRLLQVLQSKSKDKPFRSTA